MRRKEILCKSVQPTFFNNFSAFCFSVLAVGLSEFGEIEGELCDEDERRLARRRRPPFLPQPLPLPVNRKWRVDKVSIEFEGVGPEFRTKIRNLYGGCFKISVTFLFSSSKESPFLRRTGTRLQSVCLCLSYFIFEGSFAIKRTNFFAARMRVIRLFYLFLSVYVMSCQWRAAEKWNGKSGGKARIRYEKRFAQE